MIKWCLALFSLFHVLSLQANVVINISGGSFNAPFYSFTDSNGGAIDISTFSFQKGLTYDFVDGGVYSSHPFMIGEDTVNNSSHVSGTPLNGQGTTLTLTIPTGFSGSFLYFCTVHSSMQSTLTLTDAVAPSSGGGGTSYKVYQFSHTQYQALKDNNTPDRGASSFPAHVAIVLEGGQWKMKTVTLFSAGTDALSTADDEYNLASGSDSWSESMTSSFLNSTQSTLDTFFSASGYPLQGIYSPSGGNSSPGGGYQTPNGGYQTPSGGYTTPSGGNTSPGGGYQTPNGGYTTPSGGNTSPGGGYQTPSGGYTTPSGGNTSPGGGYQTPSDGYTSPSGGNASPDEGVLPVYQLTANHISFLANTSSGYVIAGNYSFIEVLTDTGSEIQIPMMYNNAGTWEPQAGFTYPSHPTNITSMADIEAYLNSENLQPINLSVPPTDYQSPSSGYSTPNSGYTTPSDGHTTPNDGYTSPGNGYTSPDDGYASPGDGYSTPNAGYTSPNDGYASPGNGYTSPDDGYSSPANGYTSPDDGYASPGDGYSTPHAGYTSPNDGYASPGNGYTSPDDGYSSPANGYSSPDNGYASPGDGTNLTAYETEATLMVEQPTFNTGIPNADSGSTWYQSFTAVSSAKLVKFAFATNGSFSASADVIIREGEGVNGNILHSGTWTGIGEILNDFNEYSLNEDVLLTQGQKYTIQLENQTVGGYLGSGSNSNPYEGGIFYFSGFGGEYGDLKMKIWVLMESQPDNSYSSPSGGYSSPDGGYPGPDDGHSPPGGDYSSPDNGYASPNGDYSPPTHDYSSPGDDYSSPGGDYGPDDGHSPPGGEYSSPDEDLDIHSPSGFADSPTFTLDTTEANDLPQESNPSGFADSIEFPLNTTEGDEPVFPPFDFTELGQIDLSNPEELAQITKDFDSIYFQSFVFPAEVLEFQPIGEEKSIHDSTVGEDLGSISEDGTVALAGTDDHPEPQTLWILSVEMDSDNETDQETEADNQPSLVIDMDGRVFAGDSEAFWRDAFQLDIRDNPHWSETRYSIDPEGIDHLYHEHPEIAGLEHLEDLPPFDFTEVDQIDLSNPDELAQLSKDFEAVYFQKFFPPHPAIGTESTAEHSSDLDYDHAHDSETHEIEETHFSEHAYPKQTDDHSTEVEILQPAPVWALSIERENIEGNDLESVNHLIVTMDGRVYAGYFESYWRDAHDVDVRGNPNWSESEYSVEDADLERMYAENEELGSLMDDPEPTLPVIVKTHTVEFLPADSYLLQGEILHNPDSKITEVGFFMAESLRGENVIHHIAVLEDSSTEFSVIVDELLPNKTYYYITYAVNESGESMGTVKRFRTRASGSWYAEMPEIDGGWRTSEWFGSFLLFENDWIYHQSLGWVYVESDGEDGLWMWSEENGWQWTRPGTWPFLYRDENAGWIYFIKNIEGQPLFYDYDTESYGPPLSPVP